MINSSINDGNMKYCFQYFQCILHTSLALYFQQTCKYQTIYGISWPEDQELLRLVKREQLSFEERVVLLLALMPHLCPQLLDIFFINNKDLDRPYTEFGGWKGLSHGGFLPTGETAAFILAGNDWEKRKAVIRLFGKEHWFWKNNILRLEGQGEGEPFLSGQLRVSEEVLSRVFYGREYQTDYDTAGLEGPGGGLQGICRSGRDLYLAESSGCGDERMGTGAFSENRLPGIVLRTARYRKNSGCQSDRQKEWDGCLSD